MDALLDHDEERRELTPRAQLRRRTKTKRSTGGMKPRKARDQLELDMASLLEDRSLQEMSMPTSTTSPDDEASARDIGTTAESSRGGGGGGGGGGGKLMMGLVLPVVAIVIFLVVFFMLRRIKRSKQEAQAATFSENTIPHDPQITVVTSDKVID